MTGFGAGEAMLLRTVRVELRAVNHRHLDVRVRVPSELSDSSAWSKEGSACQAGARARRSASQLGGHRRKGGVAGYDRARRAYAS